MLKELLALKPESFKANIQLATIDYVAGHFAEAVPYYQKAIEIDPDNAQAHFDMGNTLAKLNRQAEAEQLFRRSGELGKRR